MPQLGKHFTLDELTLSQAAARKGLLNVPTPQVFDNLRDLVKHILDPLREHLGKPVVVSSGYRSKGVNALIGGAVNSQHCLGQAADIKVPGMSVAELVKTIRLLGLPFDQLIDEFGSWVHVSYSPQHRRKALIARTVGGKTTYLPMSA